MFPIRNNGRNHGSNPYGGNFVDGAVMIYLASPYTHAKPLVRVARVAATAEIVAHRLARGRYFYSPIVHGHWIEQEIDREIPWQKWMEHSYAMISALKSISVAQLPGWDKSRGVAAEIEFAKSQKFPVTFIDPEELKLILRLNTWNHCKC